MDIERESSGTRSDAYSSGENTVGTTAATVGTTAATSTPNLKSGRPRSFKVLQASAFKGNVKDRWSLFLVFGDGTTVREPYESWSSVVERLAEFDEGRRSRPRRRRRR